MTTCAKILLFGGKNRKIKEIENQREGCALIYKKYKKDFAHSYALGPFPSFELLESRPESALAVYSASDFSDKEKLQIRAQQLNVPFFEDDKALARISDKEKCYAAAVFCKYGGTLMAYRPHVVLHNPADMGNLGTILRTLLAFGIKDLAVIEPAADLWHPKVVRASMGALFKMRVELLPDFSDYQNKYGSGRALFPFMLGGEKTLSLDNCPKANCYSLIFGNEARGLPGEFSALGTSVLIPQSAEVDSLNLAVSVAVGAFIFTTINRKD